MDLGPFLVIKTNLPYILRWHVFIDGIPEIIGDACIHKESLSDEDTARRFFRCAVRKFLIHRFKFYIRLWRKSDHTLLAEYNNLKSRVVIR